MTEKEQDEKTLTKEQVVKYSHAWWVYRCNIAYLDNVYGLLQDVARFKMAMPKGRPDELRDLLDKTMHALEKEEQDLTDLYAGEYMRLLKSCDELKDLKKEKKVRKWV